MSSHGLRIVYEKGPGRNLRVVDGVSAMRGAGPNPRGSSPLNSTSIRAQHLRPSPAPSAIPRRSKQHTTHTGNRRPLVETKGLLLLCLLYSRSRLLKKGRQTSASLPALGRPHLLPTPTTPNCCYVDSFALGGAGTVLPIQSGLIRGQGICAWPQEGTFPPGTSAQRQPRCFPAIPSRGASEGRHMCLLGVPQGRTPLPVSHASNRTANSFRLLRKAPRS